MSRQQFRVINFDPSASADPDAQPVTYDPSNNAFGTAPDDPATSRKQGSFLWDQEKGGYSLEWSSIDKFQAWRREQEIANTIELRYKDKIAGNRNGLWLSRIRYVCARQGTGGNKKYEKKHDRDRKVETKRTGCSSNVIVKIYPHTNILRGKYSEIHDHEVGNANLLFTRLSNEARVRIAEMLRAGIKPAEIRRRMQGDSKLHRSNRDQFVTMDDISRVQDIIEAEIVQLDKNDGLSVARWIEKLRSQGANVMMKARNEPAPPDSRLAADAFVLILQTEFQADVFERYGAHFLGIDATHNTTYYEGISLFSILVRDYWGHGVPIAWMVSSNGTENTIDFFVSLVKSWRPMVSPNICMTDCDQAQINVLRRHYPKARVLLCKWHVLRAWRAHFHTGEFPELWTDLKQWVRMDDEAEFQECWAKIRNNSATPRSFVAYMEKEWMPIRAMWSAVFRTGRGIFDEGDTNMLLEAWHHVLKGGLLEGKRNHRLDHLIYTLVEEAVPHFEDRHLRQCLGLEGPNLKDQRRNAIKKVAEMIALDQITVTEKLDVFLVKSQASNQLYVVDLTVYSCTCRDFPRIEFCKHISAVENHYPASVPISSCETPNSQDVSLVEQAMSTMSAAIKADSDISYILGDVVQLFDRVVTRSHNVSTDIAIRGLRRLRKDLHHVLALGDPEPPSTSSMLPEKQAVAPNQHGWSETAKVMIGNPKGKKRKKHTDAYAGGEQPGKRARPDALSAAANEKARSAADAGSSTHPGPAPAVGSPSITGGLKGGAVPPPPTAPARMVSTPAASRPVLSHPTRSTLYPTVYGPAVTPHVQYTHYPQCMYYPPPSWKPSQ